MNSTLVKTRRKVGFILRSIKPTYYLIIIGLIIILQYFPYKIANNGESVIPINHSIDKYSANALKLVNDNQYHQSIAFNWNQFLNIDEFIHQHHNLIAPLNCEEFSNRIRKSPKTFFNCVDDPNNENVPITISENVFSYIDEIQRKILANIHLLKVLPNPSKLIYLFHDNKIELNVNDQPADLVLDNIDLGKEIFRITKFQQPLTPRSPIALNYENDFNYQASMAKFHEQSTVRQLHRKYKDTRVAKQYFSEAYLIEFKDLKNLDWRFFNSSVNLGTANNGVTMATISGLIRAWLQFCEKYEIRSWLADNNLIGWSFNGLHLPMEKDFRFQLPISDLMKIIDLGFNQSIIFDYSDYNRGKIHGQYFLDISPFFKMRDRNNRENTIDMRLIDINSGLFIDIVALVMFEYEQLFKFKKKPIFQSLNENDLVKIDKKIHTFKDSKHGLLYSKELDIYRFDDINQLLPVKFENHLSFVPSNYFNILTEKYFEPLQTTRGRFKFREFLNHWIPIEACAVSSVSYKPQEHDLNCLADQGVRKLVDSTKDVVAFHNKFMEWFNNLDSKEYQLDPIDLSAVIY